MKKNICIILLLFVSLVLFGCQDKNKDKITILDLYEKNLSVRMSTHQDGVFNLLFASDDNKTFYVIKSKMTDEESEKFYGADEEKQKNIIINLKNPNIIDVSNKVPTDNELSKYVGMKILDLVNDGYYYTGIMCSDTCKFDYDSDKYMLSITVDEDTNEELMEHDEEEFNDFTIKNVKFNSLNEGIFK